MLFWIIALALAMAIAGIIVLAGLRARTAPAAPEGADLAVYRAQLAEVARDRDRGVIAGDEAERLENEIARRLLAADTAARGASAPLNRAHPVALALVALAVIGGTMALYGMLGAPGYGDQPLAARIAGAEAARQNRPSQEAAEAGVPPAPAPELSEDFATLMERLRTAVKERPDDLQGQRLLARNEATLGNFVAAHRAQARVVAILGPAATAEDHVTLGGYRVLAAGGYVSPAAETALRAALAQDPNNGAAQFYLGLMRWQTGRPDIAFRTWEALLRRGPETAPWIVPIRERIGEVARLAGVDYTPPPVAPVPDTAPLSNTGPAPSTAPAPDAALPGPSAADVAAADDMTDTDRAEMIRGMVSRLSDRLAAEGGTAEEWARLIGAYGVLGETSQARAIRDEALEVFGGDADALAVIRAAGERAGLDG